mmetsp:Transcript_120446/g.351831  ORF Transcript_120446/g.351831 Transcript_120446/m.351831 type:complete len:252 (-) Transcript_120446:236-991(-)
MIIVLELIVPVWRRCSLRKTSRAPLVPQPLSGCSQEALRNDGPRHLLETRHICPELEVRSWTSVLERGADARACNGTHDVLQPAVHQLAGPREPPGVLRHLQARDRHAAGVGGLGRPIQDLASCVYPHRPVRAWHVGPLCHEPHTALCEPLRVCLPDLVLCGARQRDQRVGDVPRPGALLVGRALQEAHDVPQPATLHVLEVHHSIQVLFAEAACLQQSAIGVRECQDLQATLNALLRGELGNVAGARDEH